MSENRPFQKSAPPPGPVNAGFSLIEMLIALSLASIVLGAGLTGLYQLQRQTVFLAMLAERDANAWALPLLFARWIPSGGNNRHRLAADVQIGGGQLRVAADIDGPTGFPDGRLDDAFEALAFRRFEDQLQMRSGRGSFQSFVRRIDRFGMLRESPRLIRLKLRSVTSKPLHPGREEAGESIELLYLLPNYRPSLFEAEGP